MPEAADVFALYTTEVENLKDSAPGFFCPGQEILNKHLMDKEVHASCEESDQDGVPVSAIFYPSGWCAENWALIPLAKSLPIC